MMRKNTLHSFFFCFILLSISIFVNAQQNNPLVNSGELIERGVKLHDEEKYKDAIKLYAQVPKSDTNYHLALHEIILSHYADSNYNACIPLINEGIKYFPDKMFR